MSHQNSGPRNYVHKDIFNQVTAERDALLARIAQMQKRHEEELAQLRTLNAQHLERVRDLVKLEEEYLEREKSARQMFIEVRERAEKAEKERDFLKQMIEPATEEARRLREQALDDEQLLLSLREALKALEFYADSKHWANPDDGTYKICGVFKSYQTWTDCGWEYDWDVTPDEGDTARTTLASIKLKHKELGE